MSIQRTYVFYDSYTPGVNGSPGKFEGGAPRVSSGLTGLV